jgi:hypothetical protein
MKQHQELGKAPARPTLFTALPTIRLRSLAGFTQLRVLMDCDSRRGRFQRRCEAGRRDSSRARSSAALTLEALAPAERLCGDGDLDALFDPRVMRQARY